MRVSSREIHCPNLYFTTTAYILSRKPWSVIQKADSLVEVFPKQGIGGEIVKFNYPSYPFESEELENWEPFEWITFQDEDGSFPVRFTFNKTIPPIMPWVPPTPGPGPSPSAATVYEQYVEITQASGGTPVSEAEFNEAYAALPETYTEVNGLPALVDEINRTNI